MELGLIAGRPEGGDEIWGKCAIYDGGGAQIHTNGNGVLYFRGAEQPLSDGLGVIMCVRWNAGFLKLRFGRRAEGLDPCLVRPGLSLTRCDTYS